MHLYLVFIVGAPGVGKDTFVNLCINVAQSSVTNLSSIDCVRTLLNISQTDKRPETRKVLSVVGEALEEYEHFRSKSTAKAAYKQLDDHSPYDDFLHSSVVFVHVREQYMIDRMTNYVRELDPGSVIRIRTVKVVNVRVATDFSNKSDAEAHMMEVSETIMNQGSFVDLQREATAFMLRTQQGTL